MERLTGAIGVAGGASYLYIGLWNMVTSNRLQDKSEYEFFLCYFICWLLGGGNNGDMQCRRSLPASHPSV